MMTSTPMKQLVAVALEGDVDGVTRALLDEGVMHFIRINSLSDDISPQLKPMQDDNRAETAGALRRRVESLLKLAEITPPTELDIATLKLVEDRQAQSAVEEVERDIAALRGQLEETETELRQITDIGRQIDVFGGFPDGIPKSSEYSYLDMHTGTVPSDQVAAMTNALSSMPVVTVTLNEGPDVVSLFVIGMRKDAKQLEPILDRHQWQDMNLNSELSEADHSVQSDLASRIEGIENHRAEITSEILRVVTDCKESLLGLWTNLRMNELYGRVQSYFSRTARTILFTGWVPASTERSLDKRIRSACSEGCYLEWHTPERVAEDSDADVPVQLQNPGFLKPFELLVRNYAVPAYGSIDPTPLVAVAYLAMFGLMFGDAGHGLVLLITGVVARLLYKKRNNVRDLLTLLAYCGGASIISGTLFGSYFGFQLFKPIWFDFHGIVSGHSGGPTVSTIYDVLGITIYFGITVIGLGLLLNWINLIRKRQWFPLVFDKAGLIGGFIYGAGIWATRIFVASGYRDLPEGRLLFLLLGIPVILLGFKAPLRHFLEPSGKLHPMSIVDFAMDWIVEVLEVFSGYLANTLSFMRVAGLGIAHEALLIAFFQIARMANGGSLGGIWSILILVVGNVLIIGLEGLSAGIQSLRLNYYEFFSKYFTGAGRPYEPVSLRGVH
jgi:V/A-type H+/Na+-transporting ATPase subunit I